MIELNHDCLWQIFTNLEQDKNSLHAAVLVNHTWCKVAIQFLWKKPFRFLYTCQKACKCLTEGRHKKAKNLLTTFITCIAQNQASSAINMQDFVIWTNAPRTAFDYSRFLRHIDLHDLFLALMDGVKYLISHKHLDYVIAFQHITKFLAPDDNWESAVIQEMARDICKLLVSHCSNLKCLSIDMANKQWSKENHRCSSLPNISFWITVKEIPEELLLIPTYPGATKSLSQLVEFYWGATHWTSEFLIALSKVSKRLRTLIIDMSNFGRNESNDHARNLGTLIKVQTALQEIQFIKCKPRVLPSIMQGLRTQAKSLRYFHFQGMVKDWSVFSELVHLTNIQELSFVKANFRCSEIEMLASSNFPNLTKLVFDTTSFRFPIIIPEIIIQSSGNKIRTFSLPAYFYPSYNGFVPTVSLSVAKYCPNLVHFEYHVTRKEFSQLVVLFDSCQHLKKVMLAGNPEDANELFLQLANLELPNLREFEITAQWSYTATSLETFFTRSKAPLRNLVIRSSPCFSDDHLKVVLRCLGDKLRRLYVESAQEMTKLMLSKANETITDFVYKMIDEVYNPGWLLE
ncbi:19358_t:CDS:1 [Dentiscutata erythropus]|uniref:19358_t:CDS:1 n=1 Tax=Dentiscutata erythropus TaxID=1348616 RepID=A0A9N8WQ63_9GLOM|nr:19358_t:CDS:1 [Dentiscutata erythropus]